MLLVLMICSSSSLARALNNCSMWIGGSSRSRFSGRCKSNVVYLAVFWVAERVGCEPWGPRKIGDGRCSSPNLLRPCKVCGDFNTFITLGSFCCNMRSSVASRMLRCRPLDNLAQCFHLSARLLAFAQNIIQRHTILLRNLPTMVKSIELLILQRLRILHK